MLFTTTHPTARAGRQRFLYDYKGYLQADAYGGYDGIYHKRTCGEHTCGEHDVIKVACWAHARQKFFDARETDGRRATQMLAMVAELYAVEDAAKEKIQLLPKQNPKAPRQELEREQEQIRLALRQDKSKPVPAKIKTWLDAEIQLVLPRSPMPEDGSPRHHGTLALASPSLEHSSLAETTGSKVPCSSLFRVLAASRPDAATATCRFIAPLLVPD